MNYKHGFVLKEAEDYLRTIDFEHLSFITKEHIRDLKLQSDRGIVYIEEHVNAEKTELLVHLLEENGVDVDVVTCVKWKKFPDKPFVYK